MARKLLNSSSPLGTLIKGDKHLSFHQRLCAVFLGVCACSAALGIEFMFIRKPVTELPVVNIFAIGVASVISFFFVWIGVRIAANAILNNSFKRLRK